MMALFQGLILTAVGLGLLGITYQSLERGWLPCGPRGFLRRLDVQRQLHPMAYWILFVLYAMFGLWVLRTGIAIAFGTMEPLPLS